MILEGFTFWRLIQITVISRSDANVKCHSQNNVEDSKQPHKTNCACKTPYPRYGRPETWGQGQGHKFVNAGVIWMYLTQWGIHTKYEHCTEFVCIKSYRESESSGQTVKQIHKQTDVHTDVSDHSIRGLKSEIISLKECVYIRFPSVQFLFGNCNEFANSLLSFYLKEMSSLA